MTLTESLAGDRKVRMCVHVFMKALCVHVYACVCAHACTYICEFIWKQRSISDVFFHHSILFSEIKLLADLEITKARLAGQQTQGLQLSLPSKHWS